MSVLRPLAPHAEAAELRRWKLDSFGELRSLRAALRETIEHHTDETDDLFDKMAVVATELATNALRHGLPPTEVVLLEHDDRLILDVADHDLGTLPEVAQDRPLGAGGLGLQLTKTFAIDVGWYRTDLTKHVWASFPS
ncbi:ATP-binding protein [Paractinoplanes lichenicola]|uniref:ATP-binding protein n=1 Tax=Paractinoplanes lichenicola TaxID=2802976 RepID=A0ABS1VSQ7_9ACTN|nr:ATP-binding protein [Actinoplanes lichenicola]MBL7257326.1 ATP-binding protein [Actinoplanes lichenicola]